MSMVGWGQAVWIWENDLPQGLTPLWLLLWTGIGVAGLTLPVNWVARRWWPAAGLAAAAWVAVPAASEMASRYQEAAGTGDKWLSEFSPLLVLSLLGLGLSGVMMIVAWYIGRRWSSPPPGVRPLREGFWAGLFVVICGWLLIIRVFTLTLAALLAGSMVLIETYMVIREAEKKS
jgi:hypothetical protein